MPARTRARIVPKGKKNPCHVCSTVDPKRLKRLHDDYTQGAPVLTLSQRYGIARTSLQRHLKAGHAEVKRPDIVETVEAGQAPDLSPLRPASQDDEDAVLRKLTDLQKISEALLARAANGGGTIDVALRCTRTVADLLSLRVDLEAKLREARVRHVVDLRLSAAFAALRQAAGEALAPYPEAAAALSAALLRALPEAKR